MNESSQYIKAIFRARPNRFIAEVEIDGEIVATHVPNTGRCKELLVEGVTVYLLPSDNPNRKTKYSLLFVENNGVLVSIYSQEANKIVYEGILNGNIEELGGYDLVQREKTVGNSRIDIYLTNHDEEVDKNQEEDCYVEVKGVTLVEDGVAIFPDAPTERGRKHLEELIELREKGHRTVTFFLIQHPNGNSFKPNWKTDPDFSETLAKAHKSGVEILVYKSKNSLSGNKIMGKSMKYDLTKY